MSFGVDSFYTWHKIWHLTFIVELSEYVVRLLKNEPSCTHQLHLRPKKIIASVEMDFGWEVKQETVFSF